MNNNPVRYTDPSGHSAWQGEGGADRISCDLDCWRAKNQGDDGGNGRKPLYSIIESTDHDDGPGIEQCSVGSLFSADDCYIVQFEATEDELNTLYNIAWYGNIIVGGAYVILAMVAAPTVPIPWVGAIVEGIIGIAGVYDTTDMGDVVGYIEDAESYAAVQPNNSTTISIVPKLMGTGIHYGSADNKAYIATGPVTKELIPLIGIIGSLISR